MAKDSWSIMDEDHSCAFYRTMAIIFFLVAAGVTVLLSMGGAFPYSLIFGYVILAFGMHIGHDCVVGDIFFGAWTKTVDLPTVIFELDADGCIQMLLYRFVLGPLLCLVLGLVLGVLGTLLAMLLSALTFPFHIVRFVRSLIG